MIIIKNTETDKYRIVEINKQKYRIIIEALSVLNDTINKERRNEINKNTKTERRKQIIEDMTDEMLREM